MIGETFTAHNALWKVLDYNIDTKKYICLCLTDNVAFLYLREYQIHDYMRYGTM